MFVVVVRGKSTRLSAHKQYKQPGELKFVIFEIPIFEIFESCEMSSSVHLAFSRNIGACRTCLTWREICAVCACSGFKHSSLRLNRRRNHSGRNRNRNNLPNRNKLSFRRFVLCFPCILPPDTKMDRYRRIMGIS